jgi:hypothetical protein
VRPVAVGDGPLLPPLRDPAGALGLTAGRPPDDGQAADSLPDPEPGPLVSLELGLDPDDEPSVAPFEAPDVDPDALSDPDPAPDVLELPVPRESVR